MPYRVSAEVHPMEYFSRLDIDFDDDLGEDSDESDTESTSASSSLSSSSTSSSSDSLEEQKISTPHSSNGSNHSIGTLESSDDGEESIALEDLFSDNERIVQYHDEGAHSRHTDEPRRQSCPDSHTLRRLTMRYLSKLSLSDSALVVEEDLASLMFHINPKDSYGRLSYVPNSYANVAA